MITVWKYNLKLTDYQVIELPVGSKPLSAGIDAKGDLVVWVLVDTEAKLVGHGFRVAGTGHQIGLPIPVYLDTVITRGGALIWHIFWEGVMGGK